MDTNVNPLFEFQQSDTGSQSSDSSVEFDASFDAPVIATPSAAVLQTVNIKMHVLVELDLAESNYTEWRCFFDAFIGMFGLGSHLSSPSTADDHRDPDWVMKDQCILSWLYNSMSKDVRAIVHVPKATAYSIWNAVHDQFRDNELHRAVYLEAEFRSIV
jgi:hypothetical protein